MGTILKIPVTKKNANRITRKGSPKFKLKRAHILRGPAHTKIYPQKSISIKYLDM